MQRSAGGRREGESAENARLPDRRPERGLLISIGTNLTRRLTHRGNVSHKTRDKTSDPLCRFLFYTAGTRIVGRTPSRRRLPYPLCVAGVTL